MISIYQQGITVTHREPLNLSAVNSAWMYSRPKEQNFKPEQVVQTDVPVHEFARFSVVVEGPILLREWIASFRDHIMWARTSRVDDLDKWTIYNGIGLYGNLHESRRAIMDAYDRMMVEKAGHQDHFRRHLPIGYMTGFSLALSFRSAIKLIKSARKLADLLPPTNAAMFKAFADGLTYAMHTASDYHLQGVISLALDSFSAEDPLARNVVIETDAYHEIGGFVVGQLKSIPLTLRAQMVRHRPLMIRDNLFDLLQDDMIMTKSMEHPMAMEFSCTKDVAQRIAMKRNCWIAQEDLWSPVIKLINGGRDEPALPCDTGACTAQRDNQLRKEGKDPAPPCPRFARLYSEPLTAEQRNAAIDYLPLRPLTRDFWEREINA